MPLPSQKDKLQMLLDPTDAKVFFKIQLALLDFANQQLGVVAGELLDNEARIEVRDALFKRHRELPVNLPTRTRPACRVKS